MQMILTHLVKIQFLKLMFIKDTEYSANRYSDLL